MHYKLQMNQTEVSKPAYAKYNMLVDCQALIISARALFALPGLFDFFIDITFITNVIYVCSFYINILYLCLVLYGFLSVLI